MGKELEALNKIQHDFGQLKGQELVSCYETIFNALKRLESIDNANPSEALECLETARKVLTKMFGKEVLDEKGINFDTIKQALLKAEKEHNSVNLLMQELDCKDMETLRKYARCGYEKINKHYLKWEDLEFKKKSQEIPVRMGETTYTLVLRKTDGGNKIAKLLYPKRNYMGEWGDIFYEEAKQFFNDLHLERVEE